MALIAYWIAHATSGWVATPTGAQIKLGNQSDNSAASYSGTESGFATSGTIQIDEATAITGLSAGVSYTTAWTVWDDVANTYATPVVGTVTTEARASTGALTAGSATVSGTAAHSTLHAATGALSAGSATVAGSAVHPHIAAGALAAAAAAGRQRRPAPSAAALSTAGTAAVCLLKFTVPIVLV
jgi:hypothetical protein